MIMSNCYYYYYYCYCHHHYIIIIIIIIIIMLRNWKTLNTGLKKSITYSELILVREAILGIFPESKERQ